MDSGLAPSGEGVSGCTVMMSCTERVWEVPKKRTFAKFCMIKLGGRVQQKRTNDDKTWGGGVIKTEY